MESFSAALRAELDAVVARYEALVRAHAEVLSSLRDRDTDALRAERDALAAENEELRAKLSASSDERGHLSRRIAELEEELQSAREQAALEQAKAEQKAALAGLYGAEMRFIEAALAKDLEGTLLLEALQYGLGGALASPPSPAGYGELKQRGLENVLAMVFRERGRKTASAPLLTRERSALVPLAEAVGCELLIPKAGERFSAASMEKVKTVSEPSEEGNVLECAMPGIKIAGNEAALVLPKVVVAAG